MKSLLIPHTLTLIAGGLYALCYPSSIGTGWFPLLFIALPIFLWNLEASTTKQSFSQILCFNLGLNLVGYYWIPQTLREFGQLPFIVSVLLGLMFSFILQPHWWLYAIFRKYRPKWFWFSEFGIIVTALIMTLMERYVPQQFPSYVGSPWLHLAPYLGVTPYLGVVAFSFMTFWVSLEMVAELTLKKMRPQVWIVLIIFILTNAFFSIKNPDTTKQLPIRIVQANVGNFLKVSSEDGDEDSMDAINQRYEDLSTTNNGFVPHLIIWPETAYPNTFYGNETILYDIFHNVIRQTDSEMLIGGYDKDMTKSSTDMIEDMFNSSILISDGKVKTSYHKNILIPFGETLPFGPLNRQIVTVVPAVSLFAHGEGTPLMETREGFRFVTPICYEILESNYMRSLLNQHGGNHFIVNHTNDSWYGDTAEPHQHLFLSKWRALEFQLPIVRSTNTGISSVIYPDGSESRHLGVGETGVLDVNLGVSEGRNTFYQVHGVLPLLGLVAFFLLITWWRERGSIRFKPE